MMSVLLITAGARGQNGFFQALGLPAPQQPVAQTQAAGSAVDRSSAKATFDSFMSAMRAIENDDRTRWQDAVACLDTSSLSTGASSTEAAREAARNLFGIINRLDQAGLLPRVETSGNSFRLFPADGQRYLLPVLSNLRDRAVIELVRSSDGTWRFSADTVRTAQRFYDQFRQMPLEGARDESSLDISDALNPAFEFVRDSLPEEWRGNELLGVELWQWIGLFAIILFGLIADRVVRLFARFITFSYLKNRGLKPDEKSEASANRAFGLLAAGMVWIWLLPAIGLPALPNTILSGAAHLFASLAGLLAGWRVVDVIGSALERRAARTTTRIDDVLVPMFRKTAKIFVFVMAIVYGAGALNINIVPLIASLGLGGVAFAFAAKDTVENFFGSIAVLIDRPFDVGDWVKIGDSEGTIESVGFRSTRIRTFYNSQITVPNANLVRAAVDNFGRRKYRRWTTKLNVVYGTTPEQLIAFTEGIRELIRTHPYTRKDNFHVRVNEFGAHSIDILLYVFHETPDWSTELRERERLILDIIRLADALRVEFAFPTQKLYLIRDDGSPPDSVLSPPQSMTERRAMIQGIRKAQMLTANQPWRTTPPGPVEFPTGPTKIDDEELAKYEMSENTRSAESMKTSTPPTDSPEAEVKKPDDTKPTGS